MNPTNNTIYLRRRGKICLPETGAEIIFPPHYIASMLKNIEGLGFTFSETLIAACQKLNRPQLTALYKELIDALQKSKGAHRNFKPMYPNFPDEVMAAEEASLYLNALLHYLTGGRFLPGSEANPRPQLLEATKLQVIDLGTQAEFEGLFGQIAASNASLSEQDREDLAWFAEAFGGDIFRLLPESIPQKENVAIVAGLLMRHTESAPAADFMRKFCHTATDALRIAASLSGGDVSLATAVKFRSFTRAERVLLLSLLEQQSHRTEDMLRWKNRWIRLGERLHPGEYGKRFPQTAESFRVLRESVPYATFQSETEAALTAKNVAKAAALLSGRPGDLARRLDHLLRLDADSQEAVLAAFGAAAEKVSTPVLLQALRHFRTRRAAAPVRVFFPKGNLAKAYATENNLAELSASVCERAAAVCETALSARFGALTPLGKVYVDPELSHYIAPFSQRSASRAFRTLTRGSQLPLPENAQTIRFFVWWKNGREPTDIDLSAALFDADFGYKDLVSYYNLKSYGGHHSGDIVDAPNGASEFIDISLEKALTQGVRYIVMTLNSYTQQPYCELPECFAGWMAREKADSGEIYEPKTVQDRLDVTADTRIAIPLIIDALERKVIWCDMALRRNPRLQNNVHGNLGGIGVTLQSLANINKSNLWELLTLHARARGEMVETPEGADTVFSVADGLPFRQEEIAANYLA